MVLNGSGFLFFLRTPWKLHCRNDAEEKWVDAKYGVGAVMGVGARVVGCRGGSRYVEG